MKRCLLLLCLLLCLAALTGCYSETDPWQPIAPTPQNALTEEPVSSQPSALPALTNAPVQPTEEPLPTAAPAPGLNG